ncbi:hypothetical protein ACE6H2_028693 [Prunus campanulata]
MGDSRNAQAHSHYDFDGMEQKTNLGLPFQVYTETWELSLREIETTAAKQRGSSSANERRAQLNKKNETVSLRESESGYVRVTGNTCQHPKVQVPRTHLANISGNDKPPRGKANMRE